MLGDVRFGRHGGEEDVVVPGGSKGSMGGVGEGGEGEREPRGKTEEGRRGGTTGVADEGGRRERKGKERKDGSRRREGGKKQSIGGQKNLTAFLGYPLNI